MHPAAVHITDNGVILDLLNFTKQTKTVHMTVRITDNGVILYLRNFTKQTKTVYITVNGVIFDYFY